MPIENPAQGRYLLRQAGWQDAIRIQQLVNTNTLTHYFLDWHDPLAWLGSQPFFLLEKQDALEATMAAPPDPPGIAWIRLFVCSWEISLTYAWQTLLECMKMHFETMSPRPNCFILALEDWLEVLLRQLEYPKYQQIIVLQRDTIPSPDDFHTKDSIRVRRMQPNDLHAVAEIDAACFEDLWIYSLETMTLAFQQSNIALIAELDSRPIGYLLATISGEMAHLARIAVHPELTRQHIATRLIHAMYRAFKGRDIHKLTLNTQSDNGASLALYDTMGFRKTGERFNIYRII